MREPKPTLAMKILIGFVMLPIIPLPFIALGSMFYAVYQDYGWWGPVALVVFGVWFFSAWLVASG